MWIKADDKLANHPKIKRAGKILGGRAKDGPAIALGMFHWLLSYCNEYLTDGFIPDEEIEGCSHCRQPMKVAHALAECALDPSGFGLLERRDNGYQIHDYHDWNPTAEEAMQLREAKSLAGRQGGLKSGQVRKQRAKQTGSTHEAAASEITKQTRSKTEANLEANGQANAKQNGSSRARDPVQSRPVPSSPDQDLGGESGSTPAGEAGGSPVDDVTDEDLPDASDLTPPPRAAIPPRIATGPHRNHASCGRPCVPSWTHDELRRHLGGDESAADQTLRAWYPTVREAYASRPIGDKPEAFWWARFREWQGTTTTRDLAAEKLAQRRANEQAYLNRQQGHA